MAEICKVTGKQITGNHEIEGVMCRYRRDDGSLVQHEEDCSCCRWGDGFCSHNRQAFHELKIAMEKLNQMEFIDPSLVIAISTEPD